MPAKFLGPDGRPMVAVAQLAQEVAAPGLTGVRQAWPTDSMIRGLTPDKLDAILRQADAGDMDAFLTLAEEMEERDPHYASVLQTRKLAVIGLERKLTWAEGDEKHPKADEILLACQKVIAAPAFEDLLLHLLDAIAKGYAAPETIWNTTAVLWTPERYEYRDPRWFKFDRATGRELRLKDQTDPEGLPLPRFKFAVHLAGRKSGLAARGGIARLVAFSFVCKLYGFKDWMAYAEIFGIPLRLGKYDASASPADVEVLKRAVFGLGSDAAAVFPKSMEIEFPDLGGATGGAELFHNLVDWIDRQVSKAVLGQTGTTDMQKGGGYAQSKVLDGVRGDLTKADARGVGSTVTSEVLAPFVLFNYGADAPVPTCELVVDEPEDMAALSNALDLLVPLGLKVKQTEVRKKLKLSEPDPEDELLTPPAATPAPSVLAAPPANDQVAAPRLIRGRAALARLDGGQVSPRAGVEATLNEIQLAALDDWEPTFGREASALVDLVKGAASFEEVRVGLAAMAKDLSAPTLARSLARAMFEAAAAAVADGTGPRQDA